MSRHRDKLRLLAGLFLAASVCATSAGCDSTETTSTQASAARPKEETPTRKWKAPEAVDLRDYESMRSKLLSFTDAQKFPDCHLVFEPAGAPAQTFPLEEASTRALKLAGCEPEGYLRLDDGGRLIAYAVAAPAGEGWDLRLVRYAASGARLWDYRLDRSANAKNFTANFRRSFIAPLPPRLVCAGTLWEGGTQGACVDADSGEEKWSGTMKFWAGVAPQPAENALNAATLTGLTRRYPFSGVEMRYKPFEENGGRSAFYATDGSRLFFVPSKGEDIAMTAYALDSFEPVWRLELDERPQPSWAHAFGEFGVVLFKIGETVYAADAESGEPLWAATIGQDEPPVVSLGGKLYMLVRKESQSNVLYELDPKTGEPGWYAAVPTGTLEVHAYEDDLILKSVRAVRRVKGL